MTDVPSAAAFTSAPLRHRLRVELDAPVRDVWALVGDHARLPEYSAGIQRVDLAEGGGARICYFRAPDGSDGPVLRELIRWEAPDVGYSTSADTPNDFGLANDLSIVTVAAAPEGRTLFTWEQHYDHADLPAMRASFDQGIVDIAERLVARFGGRVLERHVDGPVSGA
jgi:uncharacterized protein YndB with AHSA1/START domain